MKQNGRDILCLTKITSNPTSVTFLLFYMPYVDFMILKTHIDQMIKLCVLAVPKAFSTLVIG